MTLTLGDYDFGTEANNERGMTVQSARTLTPLEEKLRGFIKSTITYEDNQNFRPEVRLLCL